MTELPLNEGTEPLAPLRPGVLVDQRYRLERLAGAGGMATVWRAHDERLDRTVAIKVISDALATDPAAVARFEREARTHARIQHPHLVQVYDYSISPPQPYLVMEFVEGETLSDRLAREGLPLAGVEALIRELLSAVACVHDHGVLHRDIKSGNVLLDRQGNARLTDFGLARLADASAITRTDEIVGTLSFLAPELLKGEQATPQSDLYSLGVVLARALEALPKRGDEAPHLAELASWLQAPEPEHRPRSAHEALERLSSPSGPMPTRPAAVAPGDGSDAPTEALTKTLGLVARNLSRTWVMRRPATEAGTAPPTTKTRGPGVTRGPGLTRGRAVVDGHGVIGGLRLAKQRAPKARPLLTVAALVAVVALIIAVTLSGGHSASVGAGAGGSAANRARAGGHAQTVLASSRRTGSRRAGSARNATATLDRELTTLADQVRRAAAGNAASSG